jgi:DnaJ-class molecular chaperone
MLDLLGRPVWEVSVEDISKAYRKLARFCHPDKVSGMSEDEAKQAERAYETLRLAKECLSKEDSRGPYVREHCQFLRPDKSALEIRSDDITGSIERSSTPRSPSPFPL